MRAYLVIPAAQQTAANNILVAAWGAGTYFNVPLARPATPTVPAAYWLHGRLFPAMVPAIADVAALPGVIRWYRVDLLDHLLSTNDPNVQFQIGGLFGPDDIFRSLNLQTISGNP